MIENARALFNYVTHGVYVISVTHGKEQNAFTAAWVMQASFDPPMIAYSINPGHYSYQLLKASGVCTVNVLGQDHLAIAAHFGQPGVKEKMTKYRWQTREAAAPILSDGLVYFDCKLSHTTDAGDHKIAVCEVVAAAELNSGWPLLYSQTGNMDRSGELYKT
ncbi:flavin reductase [Methyloglobulus morosus KoM1]|uniref:Flavin reductase n=1 Tax=Methyloglobulus morosus KoM1 TaxID=1116472 RepID=V5B575_9GAMM|nr:flavin reductase family protein [Methyloglobulus morosus]ESS68370.1 flavin reductase [Methyloglobulus morosus KoM1]